MKINRKRAYCSILVIIVLLLIFSVSVFAGASKKIVLTIGNPYMYVDNIKKEIDTNGNTSPVIRDGRTLLPIRAITEELGAEVDWDSKERMVTIKNSSTTIIVWIDRKDVKVNEQYRTIDVSPIIINERTMLPLRFIAENLNCYVNWNAQRQEVTIIKIDGFYSFKKNVKILEIEPSIGAYAEELLYINNNDTKVVLKVNAPDSLKNLKTNDVFVIISCEEYPDGYSAKVLEVSQTNDKVSMILTTPLFEELFVSVD